VKAILEVSLGPDEPPERLLLHEGELVSDVVDAFVSLHNLSPDVGAKLQSKIHVALCSTQD